MCKMDIIAGIEEALKVGNLKFSRSNVRPGESVGVGEEDPVVFKVSAIVIDGVEMFIWMFPNDECTIYGGDIKDLIKSMTEHLIDPKVDRDWRGHRHMITHKWVKERQVSSGDVHFSDYGHLSYIERDKILDDIEENEAELYDSCIGGFSEY